MTRKFVFAAALALCVMAISVSAQKTAEASKAADFSGKWNLDLAKSELGQSAAMIKSQTMTITQAGTSFKVSTQTERNAPPADASGGGRPAGGGGGGMGGGAGEQAYTLDGKEVSSERQTQQGTVTTKTKAEQTGNKVTITSVFPTPNGDITSTQTFELSADGKSLTVTRASTRGTTKSVYIKG